MLLLTVATALAVTPGPHPVGYRDVVFEDAVAGTVYARVHYPALTSGPHTEPDADGGPYPLAALLHGYLGSAWMYQGAADHIASLGFVVVNMDTETGVVLDIERYAQDTRAALAWIEGRDAADGLDGLTDGGPIVAMGHSMGGATLSRLIQIEPRVDTLIGFMPYLSEEPPDYLAFGEFTGDALYLGGTSDETATHPIVRDWYRAMDATGRGLWMELADVGHQAVSDIDFGDSPTSDAEERDIVLTLAEDFLRARRFGEAEGWRRLLDATPPHTAQASASNEPLVLVEPTEDGLAVTVAARGDGPVALWAGRGPGSTLADGVVVALREAVPVGEVTLADGIGRGELPVPEALDGLAWVQAMGADGPLGDPIDVHGVGDPGPSPGSDTDAPGAEDLGSAGCATVPVPTGWALLALALVRRRRS